jgi:hypothetical protein
MHKENVSWCVEIVTVRMKMKKKKKRRGSCGWGVALALFVLVQRGMVWAGCHAFRLSLMPSGGCLVAQCNNSSIKKKRGGVARSNQSMYDANGDRQNTTPSRARTSASCRPLKERRPPLQKVAYTHKVCPNIKHAYVETEPHNYCSGTDSTL